MVPAMLAAMVLAGYPADVPVAGDDRLDDHPTATVTAREADEASGLTAGRFALASASVAGLDLVGTTAMGVGGMVGVLGLVVTLGGPFTPRDPNLVLGIPMLVGGAAVFLAGSTLSLIGPPVASSLLLSPGEGRLGERLERALPGIVAAGAIHLLAGACLYGSALLPTAGLPLMAGAAGLELVGQPLAAWAANRAITPQVTVVRAEF